MLRGHTFWELLERRVDATPDALMAVDEDMATITFGEYWSEAERAAAGLVDAGVVADSVVAWQLPTWIESLVLIGALSRIGVVQNPILPTYRESEVVSMIDRSDTSLLVVPSVWRGFDYEAMGRSVSLARGGTIRVLVSDRALPQGDPSTLPAIVSDDDAYGRRERWLFHTAGTTSGPTAVLHSDASIESSARGLAERLGVIQGDRYSMVAPVGHITGITWLFVSLLTGCSNILVEEFDPLHTPEVLSRENVTLAGSDHAVHTACLDHQRRHGMPAFPNLRALPGSGGPDRAALLSEVRECFDVPVMSGYGLTEAPVLTMADLSDTDDDLAVGEGRPLPGVDLRFVTLDGRIAAPGEVGEIRARGPQLMCGYLDLGRGADAVDEDGFLRTGDLGYVDERGNVVLTGRVADLITTNGETVSATELEDLLGSHPSVGDVAVIGLPDADSGGRVCAVVQTLRGSQPLTLDSMVRFLREAGLAPSSHPVQLESIDTIPRNGAGRVPKHVLVDLYK